MALVVIALSLGVARAAADGVKFGVNDDEGMFQKGAGPFDGTRARSDRADAAGSDRAQESDVLERV